MAMPEKSETANICSFKPSVLGEEMNKGPTTLSAKDTDQEKTETSRKKNPCLLRTQRNMTYIQQVLWTCEKLFLFSFIN